MIEYSAFYVQVLFKFVMIAWPDMIAEKRVLWDEVLTYLFGFRMTYQSLFFIYPILHSLSCPLGTRISIGPQYILRLNWDGPRSLCKNTEVVRSRSTSALKLQLSSIVCLTRMLIFFLSKTCIRQSIIKNKFWLRIKYQHFCNGQ